MRDLVVNVASYWGLDEGPDEKRQREFLDPFDSLAASGRGELESPKEATIKGLFRFCFEMASC